MNSVGSFIKIIILCIYLRNYECNKASLKCKEYAKAVYVKKESPVLTMNDEKNTVSECGISAVPLIIGGTRASEKEFPHMVTIGFGSSLNQQISWDCGGSLISDLYVLTAAHCLKSRQRGPAQKVKLGVIKIDDNGPDLEEKVIVERIAHPNYKQRSKINDIALLKMDSPVDFTPAIRPACLNTLDIKHGQEVLASGFGKILYEDDCGSPDLMKVTLKVYDVKYCSALVKNMGNEVNDSVLCAGELSGGKDTCQGDSGGPLQTVLTDPYCMYSIIGVTSFGKFCGFPNSPAIYTKIAKYVPWIENIVWK